MKTFQQVKAETRARRPDLTDREFEIASRYAMTRLVNERNVNIAATFRGVKNQLATTRFISPEIAKLTVTWTIDMLMGAYDLPTARRQ